MSKERKKKVKGERKINPLKLRLLKKNEQKKGDLIDQTKPRQEVEETEETRTEEGERIEEEEGINQTQPRRDEEETREAEGETGKDTVTDKTGENEGGEKKKQKRRSTRTQYKKY